MLNFATIGTSWITSQMIEAARLTQHYHLKAVHSRHLDKAKQFQQDHGADYYTTDISTLLYDPEIQVVYIATPNSTHVDYALQAVEAKKHVIIEKPMFTSSAQWHQVYDLAQENQVRIFEAALHYHSRNYSRLRPLIKQKIESCQQPVMGANFNIGQYSSKYEAYLEARENGWQVPNVFSATYAGGSLMDLGVYPLYIAIDLFGMPQTIRYHAINDGQKIDLFGTIILTYAKFQVTIFVSKAVHSLLASEIYVGEETFVIDNISRIDKAKLVNKQGESVQLINYLPANPMYDELMTFAEVIQSPGDIHHEVRYENWRQLSLQVTQVMDLLRQSAKLI